MKQISVLLIEDNEGDIILSKELLSQVGCINEIMIINNGEDAKSYLTEIITSPISNSPHWVMLDLNLPKIDGKELLLFIKNNPVLTDLPVIIYSSSESETDIEFCIHNGASLYLTKAYSIEDFSQNALKIRTFLAMHFGIKDL